MAETLTTHQCIATDEYWDTASQIPTIPLTANLLDGFTSVHVAASYGATKVQGLYRGAMRNGHLATSVQPGEELPLLERGSGLLRIIEDTRQFPISDSLLSKLWHRKEGTPEEFDELADVMLGDHLYRGQTAKTTVAAEGSEEAARIWRTVYYLTGSRSGSQLEGISSSYLFTAPNQLPPWNHVIPPLIVGSTYARNKTGTVTSKIVAAEILIRGGKKARAPKKAVVSVRPRLAFNA